MPAPEPFGPEGKRLLLPADGQRLLLFEAGAGQPLLALRLRAQPRAWAFAPDGERLASGDAKGQLQLWSREGKPLGEAGSQPTAIAALCFGRSAQTLFSAADDGALQRWTASDDGLNEPTPLEGHDAAVQRLQRARSGKLLLSADAKGLLGVREAERGEPLHSRALLRHDGPLRDLGLAANERVVWSLDESGRLTLWELASGKRLGQTPAGLLAVAALGKQLVALERAGLRAWSVEAQPLGEPRPHGLRGEALALQARADGEGLLLLSRSGELQAFDAALKPQFEPPLQLDGEPDRLALSPDGSLALAWSAERAQLLDTASGKPMGPALLLKSPPPAPAPLQLGGLTLTRIGSERVVSLNGVTGLFTPLSGAVGDAPAGADERANLQAVIDRLRREVGELEGRNLRLQADLAALRERPAAPEDFATGVQQSLDEMQQRLLSMRNASSNFAVREFKLEASVYVQLSPLGSIEYRFVQPGEAVEPASLSKLSLQLVPLPKGNLAGVWLPELFQPELPLAALPELSSTQAELLERQGLYGLGEFLQVATRARVQVQLAALLGVERLTLQRWAQQALLLSLRGMSGRAAQLLVAIGLDRFERLAALEAPALRAAYEAARAQYPEAPPLDEALAAQWLRAVRQYLGLPVAD